MKYFALLLLPLLGFWMPADSVRSSASLTEGGTAWMFSLDEAFPGSCSGWFCSASGGNNCSCGIFSCSCYTNAATKSTMESVRFAEIRMTVNYLNAAGFTSEAARKLKNIGGRMAIMQSVREANDNFTLLEQFEEAAHQLTRSEKEQFNDWLKSKGATKFIPL